MSDKLKTLTLTQYLSSENRIPRVPIVEGILFQSEFVILSASAKTGKSLFAANLAIAIAVGRPFLSHFKVNQGRVLLIQTEISTSAFQERIEKMLTSVGLNAALGDQLLICEEKLRIDQESGLAKLEATIDKWQPSLVILDPFYTMHKILEDSASAVAPLLADLKQSVTKRGAACLLIHHQGKRNEAASTAQAGHRHRGSSAFADVPDSSWSLERQKTKNSAKLTFESRNSAAPDTQQLIFDEECLWWSCSSDNSHSPVEDRHHLLREVLVEKGLTPSELISELTVKGRMSERSAQRRVQQGLESGVIVHHGVLKSRSSIYELRELAESANLSCPIESGDLAGSPNISQSGFFEEGTL